MVQIILPIVSLFSEKKKKKKVLEKGIEEEK